MTKKNSSKKVDIWLIGPGYMGIEYAKVLMALDLTFKVIGRSNKNKISFYKETGHIVEKNNLESCIKNFDLPDKVIVATNIENIIEITKKLIKRGVKNILIEKPGSLIKKELMSIKYNASKINSNIYIAYNRRFYESVIEAKKIINKDKGILSTFFNFTEISEQIKNISFPKKIKNRWLIANSSHVIDLVFHLCGKPKNLTSITEGNIDWHPSSSIFVGSGKTEKGVLFSYSSNWQSPGRWYIEIMTKNNKLIFCPLEKLRSIKKGSFDPINIELKSKYDEKFKPGLYNLVKAFILNDKKNLCSINEQIINLGIYSKIANYKN